MYKIHKIGEKSAHSNGHELRCSIRLTTPGSAQKYKQKQQQKVEQIKCVA